jgi:hypothetical protein
MRNLAAQAMARCPRAEIASARGTFNRHTQGRWINDVPATSNGCDGLTIARGGERRMSFSVSVKPKTKK